MHCFDYETLPEITKNFIDGEFGIEMQTEEDAYKLTQYFNNNSIGWYTRKGEFVEILSDTFQNHLNADLKHVTFASTNDREGIMIKSTYRANISTNEFLKQTIDRYTALNLDDWSNYV